MSELHTIVIEGADGVGKTTLAKKIAEAYNLDVVHVTSHDPNDFDFYFNSLRKTGCVYDRNVIGELIYPEVFGRQGKLIELDAEYLVNRFRRQGVKFLVLTSEEPEIRNRLVKRGGEDERVLKHLPKINRLFGEYAIKFNLPTLDTTNFPPEALFNKAEEILCLKNHNEPQ